MRWVAPLIAFFTGGALLLILHTHGHVIEHVYLRYLLVWVPVILLAVKFSRKNLPFSNPDHSVVSLHPSGLYDSSRTDKKRIAVKTELPNRLNSVELPVKLTVTGKK